MKLFKEWNRKRKKKKAGKQQKKRSNELWKEYEDTITLYKRFRSNLTGDDQVVYALLTIAARTGEKK